MAMMTALLGANVGVGGIINIGAGYPRKNGRLDEKEIENRATEGT